jgi:hypothetical protein
MQLTHLGMAPLTLRSINLSADNPEYTPIYHLEIGGRGSPVTHSVIILPSVLEYLRTYLPLQYTVSITPFPHVFQSHHAAF